MSRRRDILMARRGAIDAVPQDPACPWIIDDLTRCGWSTIPAFLPPVCVGLLASEANTQWLAQAFHPAQIGRGPQETRRTESRSDHVLWLDEATTSGAQVQYFARMEVMRLQIEEQLFLGMATVEAHLALYPIGSRYHRHSDALQGVHTRVLSTVLYLNDSWDATDGGALRLHVPEGDEEVIHDILPLAGTLALFLSDEIEHEVLPALRERLSITGWLLRR